MVNLSNIYMDASSTTPPSKDVIEVIADLEGEFWGNPSSIHKDGMKALEVLERSRASISNSLSANVNDIIYTSGATESINIAFSYLYNIQEPGNIIITSIEHAAVNQAVEKFKKLGWKVKQLQVDKHGRIKIDNLYDLIDNNTKFLSLIWAHNEVGTIQPINQVGKICRENNIVFHTDATQMVPHSKIDWHSLEVDLLSCSAHKFQGPKGIGILLKKSGLNFDLIKEGNSLTQEKGYRPGTISVSNCAAMAKALENLACQDYDVDNKLFNSNVANLTNKLKQDLASIDGLLFTGDNENRIPNHISLIVCNNCGIPLSGNQIVRELSSLGYSISSGSACSSGISTDSKVLKSMSYPSEYLRSGVRISLGPWLTHEDINNFPSTLNSVIKKLSNQL